MFTLTANCYCSSLCDLAEGPVWNRAEQKLYWLDIKKCIIETGEADQVETFFDAGQNIGCFAFRKDGGVILGETTGIYLWDKNGSYTKLEEPVVSDRVRFNDGKCDAFGRFWAGTISMFQGEEKQASLYCILPDHRVRCMLNGVTNSNGLAFSKDAAKMYYIDTPTGNVDVFDIKEHDSDFPELLNRRTLYHFEPETGYPDGMTIDTNGNLWISVWGSGRVYCISSETGIVQGTVEVPVKAVSSCCFGGKQYKTLFITTAREGMLETERTLAGNIYYIETDVCGDCSFEFNG